MDINQNTSFNSNEIAFDNLNRLIEDSEILANKIVFKTSNLEGLENDVDEYFSKYEYKPNIIKGLTSTIKHKSLIVNKFDHLNLLLRQFEGISMNRKVPNLIDDDESYLKFFEKSVIENRIIPLITFVVFEISLCLEEHKESAKNHAEEIDLSDTNGAEKIVMLQKLGILDYLKALHPFDASTNLLASAISGITGMNANTVQSYINPIANPTVSQKNNPLKRDGIVNKVIKKLSMINFKSS